MIENYVAFDFETASGKNPCSIGIVEFSNGDVVNEYYSLINPMIEKFNPFAIRVHGIRKKDVVNEREFDEIWNDIKHFFENSIIVAHNSSFDVSVLNYSLERYNLKTPKNNCYCTLKMSRKLLELNNYKLSSLAEYYSVQQNNYHNALEDAYVCGKVFSNLLKETDDVASFLKSLSTNTVKKKSHKSKIKPLVEFNELQEQIIYRRISFEKIKGFLTNKLEGQSFVVTGVFESVSRNDLKKFIEDNGGKNVSSISSKTNFIIAGDKMGPSKKEKAEKLGITLISEYDFLKMIE